MAYGSDIQINHKEPSKHNKGTNLLTGEGEHQYLTIDTYFQAKIRTLKSCKHACTGNSEIGWVKTI
jgi:hypothetical protein